MGHWGLGLSIGLVLAFLFFKFPILLVNFLIKRRFHAYQAQLVDALSLLGNGIRAGLSVPQSIALIVEEMPSPISQEFNIILQQNKIGVPLEECFENLAKRVPNQDNDMFVASVNILRETGGNLAATFDTIVEVIRERGRLQQKVETYVAQGMMQGCTIAFMPFGIGFIYFLTDPKSMELVFSHPLGIIMLIAALILDGMGFFIILKVVQIKY
jgi:tight adherence protein B